MKSKRSQREQPQAAGRQVEILVYGEIGASFWDEDGGVTAKNVKAQLAGLDSTDEVLVRINSPGGDAFEGVAIYNVLVDAAQRVIVKIDGTAISAASIIAMAGAEIHIAENALLMIHDPWTCTCGDAAELRATAERLDKVAEAIGTTYARRSGQTQEQVREWMAAETWFSAEEALAAGLATHVDSASVDAAAMLTEPRIAAYKRPPDAVRRWLRATPQESLQTIKVAAMATRTADDHPPPPERGDNTETEQMKTEEIQAALDRATEQVTALRTERDQAVARAAAIEAQNTTLVAERDAAVAKATALEHAAIEAEVRALVGVKFAAAEVDDQIALAKRDHELFARLAAQRSPMSLLVHDPAGMGPEPKPRALTADADGAGFANLIEAALNG